jgi:hypothetical protein
MNKVFQDTANLYNQAVSTVVKVSVDALKNASQYYNMGLNDFALKVEALQTGPNEWSLGINKAYNTPQAAFNDVISNKMGSAYSLVDGVYKVSLFATRINNGTELVVYDQSQVGGVSVTLINLQLTLEMLGMILGYWGKLVI